jgi:hypothetical protein
VVAKFSVVSIYVAGSPRSPCQTDSAVSSHLSPRSVSARDAYRRPLGAEVIVVTEHRSEALARLDAFVGEWVIEARFPGDQPTPKSSSGNHSCWACAGRRRSLERCRSHAVTMRQHPNAQLSAPTPPARCSNTPNAPARAVHLSLIPTRLAYPTERSASSADRPRSLPGNPAAGRPRQQRAVRPRTG